MLRDRFHFRKTLRRISSKSASKSNQLEKLHNAVMASVDLAKRRQEQLPKPELDSELPIFERRQEIIDTIANHPVVIISGETGSGKSTQLPLIAMQMELGVFGYIGHTQPRRIAARSVASRIASQIHTPLGEHVGFKIRFDDQTKDTTYAKLMTDGILLAETQSDRFLEQYEMLIIDEAHERSLNIDFLIGHLKRILAKRNDLKVVITSATIDTERFAEHFAVAGVPAPIICVEGRTYPVEMRYSPTSESAEEEETVDHIVESITQVASEESGDILVFLPTEKDIKTASKKLKGVLNGPGAAEVLPLYGRLSGDQQNTIFQPGSKRRIVLATNVAESSITVPRIRIVVDSGTARISRYAPRSKVQRLPIEAVSQASANQRAGRCGRIGPGICVRLYSEEDFESRPKFTTPEIRRTNLASVILQTLALKLGDVAEFPFIDPPHVDAIRDGYKTLFEIGAIDDHRKLTPIGRWLARLPVDPRIGRMLYAANDNGCLSEVLIVASALEVQDPRIRPPEKQKLADEQHQKFKHEKSDFMSYLLLWDFFHALRADLSKSKYRKACQHNFLSLTLIHQWQEIHRQLKSMCRQHGLSFNSRKDDYNAIHRALMTGLLSGIATLTDKYEYSGAGGIKFNLWPGSGVFASKPKWTVVAEIVETAKRYGRTVAKISPDWIESLAAHLTKSNFVDPHWSKKSQTAMAYENVSLFGLPVVNRRRKHYAKIDPELARKLFIEHGLAESQIHTEFDFLKHNREVIASIENSAAKTRRRDWLVDNVLLCRFYDERLPETAVDVRALQRLLRDRPELNMQLQIQNEDLGLETSGWSPELFPDTAQVGGMHLPIDYRFEPGHENDGATLTIPQNALSQIDEIQIGWLIPGLNESRIIAMIKSLPKALRRHFVPAPETAKKVVHQIESNSGTFEAAVAQALSRIVGETISPDMFSREKVDSNLLLNIQVVDEQGETVATSRNLTELRKTIGVSNDNFVQVADETWLQDQLTKWSWGDLPESVAVRQGVSDITLYPAIVDQTNAVGLRVVQNQSFARNTTEQGLVRLFAIHTRKSLRRQVNWLPDLDQHSILLARLLSSDELKSGLQDMISRMALIESRKSLPTTAQAFDDRVDNSSEPISVATQKVAGWLPKFANAYHKAKLALEELADTASIATNEMEQQIAELTNPGFLGATPWIWLENFPRYFSAIQIRCDRLKTTGVMSDREQADSVLEFWEKYVETRENHSRLSVHDKELEKYRWMIEEFRVSKFAQKLGTCLKVSEIRLNRQFEKVKKL